MMNLGKKCLVWLLILATLTVQSGFLVNQAHAQETQEEIARRVAALEHIFNALESAGKEIPRETFDFKAALELTDLTAGGLFTWVRDNTYLVPYTGALRGAQGVLMDRVGNSLDRALLLQGLLQLLGYDTQLARAELGEQQAQDILTKTRPIPAEGALPQTIETDTSAQLQKYADEFGLNKQQVTDVLAKAKEQREGLKAELGSRVASQTAFLQEQLDLPKSDKEAEKARQVAALQDHWWVQYQEGGVWLDLDPSLPNAEAGQKPATPGETLTVAKLEDLPQDLLHTLQIRVVLECIHDHTLQETILLESPVLIPANLLGERVQISHIPFNMPQKISPMDNTALSELILEQNRWFPVLNIGSKQFFTRDYTSSCEIGAATPPSMTTAVGGALGDVLDVLGETEGTSPKDAEERVSAQWIDYIVHVPNEADQVVRRQIFDNLGPAARMSDSPSMPSGKRLAWRLALLGSTDILPLVSQISPDYATNSIVQSLLANRKMLQDSLLGVDSSAEADTAKYPLGQLYSLALARQTLLPNNGIYLSQVNLITYHRQWSQDQAGSFTLLEGYDIVHNYVAVDSRMASDSSMLRLRQGVLDTNAENLIGDLECQRIENLLCESVNNTGKTLAESQLAKPQHPWSTIRTLQELKEIILPEDYAARLRQDIEQGYIVVLPTRPIADANDNVWWRVDPRTGQSLGMGDRGWGVSTTEYGLVVNVITSGFCIAGGLAGKRPLTSVLFCVGGAVAGVGALYAAGTAAGILAAVAALYYGVGGNGY